MQALGLFIRYSLFFNGIHAFASLRLFLWAKPKKEPHGGGEPWQGCGVGLFFPPTQSKQPWQAYVSE